MKSELTERCTLFVTIGKQNEHQLKSKLFHKIVASNIKVLMKASSPLFSFVDSWKAYC